MITHFLERRARQRLRRTMRGYRLLRASGQLNKITDIKDVLTTRRLNMPVNASFKLFFGCAQTDAERITRQYLLSRLGGINLNKALLYALGEPGAAVVHPLPPEWRTILRQHGFKVSVGSVLRWNGWVVCCLGYGIVSMAQQFIGSIREIFFVQYGTLGRYVYFDSLIAGSLPQPGKDGISHDVVSWYHQSSVRTGEVDTICHNVRSVARCVVQQVPVSSIPSPLPPLTRATEVACFLAWGVAATTLVILDIVRGRWWHALMFREAVSAAVVRLQHSATRLARDYLFHNSGWIYRPLWTYETEKRGSRTIFYFYSTNCEPFKQASGYRRVLYGWRATSWPRYLVWDEYQAEFVRRAAGSHSEIHVVGSIWFQTSAEEVGELPVGAVAVFDVQPFRDSHYRVLGLPEEYFTPATTNQFLLDIHAVLNEIGGVMALKRKRQIGYLLHPKYSALVDQLDKSDSFIAIAPEKSVQRVIEKCVAVISMPFTSTALLGREVGKPSVYYDPHGVCQKDDRAAHGVEILSGKEELRVWLYRIVGSVGRHPVNGVKMR